MKDEKIFTKLTITLQCVMDAVVTSHTHYKTGTSPISKIAKAVSVFDLDYHCFLDRNELAKRKRRGLGNARAVMYKHGEKVVWFLLATSPSIGHHPLHKAEVLQDALAQHTRIELDGYELVRLPKSGTNLTKLTWRMNESKYQSWRDYIIQTVRSRSHNSMHNMLYQLWSSPGFSGVRSQVGKLATLYRAEVKRAGLKDAPKPPPRLSYVRRLRHDGLTVKQLIAQHKTERIESAESVNV